MTHKHGFTLTELSVVLVVIALLIAGVTAGRNAITNAKLQTVVKEFISYEEAIHNFRDKFRYYPGDLPNAETYWGAAATDNGNGDWKIYRLLNESAPAWDQLNLAGFITETYTGIDAGTPDFAPKVNLPPTAYNDVSQYYVQYWNDHFNRYGNALTLCTNNSDTNPYGGAMPPKHAAKIDAKIDDGIANTGHIYSVNGNGDSGCSAALSSDGADYDFSTTSGTPCRILFWLEKK